MNIAKSTNSENSQILKILIQTIKVLINGTFSKTNYSLPRTQTPSSRLHFINANGAFMQVMDKDAKAVSDITGIQLQMAGNVNAPVVGGGFPKSALK